MVGNQTFGAFWEIALIAPQIVDDESERSND
jgi:hypothetical protein